MGSAQARTINAAGVDIGAFEGGGAPQPPKKDAGLPPQGDGAVPAQDGSTPAADGASTGGDGGSGARPSEGCGCNSTHATATLGRLTLALALLFACARR